MPLTKQQATEIMQEHGYKEVSEAGSGAWVGFGKTFNGVWMTATAYLERESVTLYAGTLQYSCKLSCESFDIKSKKFGEFETALYFYATVCSQVQGLVIDNDLVKKLCKTASEGVSEVVNDGVKTLQDRIDKFKKDVIAIGKEKYPAKMCKEFFDYWSETNAGGKKMRWEIQKQKGGVFNIERRLVTWAGKDELYKSNFKDRDDRKADKLNKELNKEVKVVDTKKLF